MKCGEYTPRLTMVKLRQMRSREAMVKQLLVQKNSYRLIFGTTEPTMSNRIRYYSTTEVIFKSFLMEVLKGNREGQLRCLDLGLKAHRERLEPKHEQYTFQVILKTLLEEYFLNKEGSGNNPLPNSIIFPSIINVWQ